MTYAYTAPCHSCAGLGRVVGHGRTALQVSLGVRSPGYEWCRSCGSDDRAGTGTSSACPECTVECYCCAGDGVARCAVCGSHGCVAGTGDMTVCAACADAGEVDAHAERCSQWSAWVDGIESVPGAVSRRGREAA